MLAEENEKKDINQRAHPINVTRLSSGSTFLFHCNYIASNICFTNSSLKWKWMTQNDKKLSEILTPLPIWFLNDEIRISTVPLLFYLPFIFYLFYSYYFSRNEQKSIQMNEKMQ